MTFCSIVNIIKDKGSALHGRPGISDWIGERMRPTEEMIRTFEKDRFATCNGAVIDQVGDHYAKCSLRIEENHRNAMGAVMGGVYFTLADFAFAVAANWQHMETVSLNSEIAYPVSYTHLDVYKRQDSAAAVMFCSLATAKKYSNKRKSIKITSIASIKRIFIKVNYGK